MPGTDAAWHDDEDIIAGVLGIAEPASPLPKPAATPSAAAPSAGTLASPPETTHFQLPSSPAPMHALPLPLPLPRPREPRRLVPPPTQPLPGPASRPGGVDLAAAKASPAAAAAVAVATAVPLRRKTAASLAPLSIVDGAASEGSGGQSGGQSEASRMSTTGRSLARLRRLLTDSQQPMLRGLQLLLHASTVSALCTVALGLAVLFIARTAFINYTDSVDYVMLGVERLFYKAKGIYAMQGIRYISAGWVHGTTADTDAFKAQMVGNSTLFSRVHAAMSTYALSQAALAPYYSTNFITIRRFDAPAGGQQGIYSYLNLVQAGNLFASTITSMSNDPVPLFSSLNYPSYKSIIYDYMTTGNGHGSMFESMVLGYETLLDGATLLINAQLGIYLGMMVLSIGLCFGFTCLWVAEDTSDNIMTQFLALPPKVRTALHSQAVERVRLLRETITSEDGEEEEDDLDADAVMDIAAVAEVAGGGGSDGGAGAGGRGGADGGSAAPLRHSSSKRGRQPPRSVTSRSRSSNGDGIGGADYDDADAAGGVDWELLLANEAAAAPQSPAGGEVAPAAAAAAPDASGGSVVTAPKIVTFQLMYFRCFPILLKKMMQNVAAVQL